MANINLATGVANESMKQKVDVFKVARCDIYCHFNDFINLSK